jgi:hypothetical protein
MDGRTVDVTLQHFDGRLAARLTVVYPPPLALEYGGQQWYRTGGFGSDDAVYRPEHPFARPATEEEPIPRMVLDPGRRRR